MKKLILSLTLLIAAVAGASALEHTVQRGETLESVAKAYNITTQQLVNANPGADKLFYVGLKLNIPEANAAATMPAANESVQTLPVPDAENTPETTEETSVEEEQGPGWTPILDLNFGFTPKEKGLKNQVSLDIAASFGAAYWFMNRMDGVFASAALGYDGKVYSYPADKISTTIHMISVPIKAGYAISTANRNFAVTPYIGFDLAITVAGSSKMGDYKFDVDTGKFIPTFKVGAMIRLASYDVGAYFRVPMGDEAKAVFGSKGHFGISVSYGF